MRPTSEAGPFSPLYYACAITGCLSPLVPKYDSPRSPSPSPSSSSPPDTVVFLFLPLLPLFSWTEMAIPAFRRKAFARSLATATPSTGLCQNGTAAAAWPRTYTPTVLHGRGKSWNLSPPQLSGVRAHSFTNVFSLSSSYSLPLAAPVGGMAVGEFLGEDEGEVATGGDKQEEEEATFLLSRRAFPRAGNGWKRACAAPQVLASVHRPPSGRASHFK